MAIALSIFGVVFASLCVQLTLRIINRRERWAKWMAVGVALLPVLYVAGFGPVCWLVGRDGVEEPERAVASLPACSGPSEVSSGWACVFFTHSLSPVISD